MKIKKFNESNNDKWSDYYTQKEICDQYIKDIFIPLSDSGISYKHEHETSFVGGTRFEDIVIYIPSKNYGNLFIEVGECIDKLERDGHSIHKLSSNGSTISFQIVIKKK